MAHIIIRKKAITEATGFPETLVTVLENLLKNELTG
jgi:hypothetical protein